MDKPSRRYFFRIAGAAVAAAGSQLHGTAFAEAEKVTGPGYRFFNPAEAAFVEAAVERLIPSDAEGPGALDAGVPHYIDLQLAGAWGAGERLYRSGPWQPGEVTQGYQLPFTPAELFRHALRGLLADLQQRGVDNFAHLSPQSQDSYLHTLQAQPVDFNGVPSALFFESLLEITIEGYFSDPVYGGNKDMAAWKMIGFPGAYASYYDQVDRHGEAYRRAPVSLAETGRGVIHLHPQIPAELAPARK